MPLSTTSIHDYTLKAAGDVRKLLKARGITVPEVEGGHDSNYALRGLQELQEIARALEASAAPASTSASSSAPTGETSTGKK